MLVCSISLRHSRTVTADIVEPAGAAIDVVGLRLFAVLVDEPAAARDTLDASGGAILIEVATAADVVSAGGTYLAAIVEDTIASATSGAFYAGVPIVGALVEAATASSSQDATTAATAARFEGVLSLSGPIGMTTPAPTVIYLNMLSGH